MTCTFDLYLTLTFTLSLIFDFDDLKTLFSSKLF